MIGIEEFKKRITELLKKFKKRTKVLACSVLDKDGVILASLKDDFMENDLYFKKVLEIYTAIESLSEKGIEILDIHEKREIISLGVVGESFTNGFMILIKSIAESLIFLTISPILPNTRPLLTKFDKLIDELSIFQVLEPENQEILNMNYNLI